MSTSRIWERMHLTPLGRTEQPLPLVKYDAAFAAFQEYHEPHNRALRNFKRTIARTKGRPLSVMSQTEMPI